MIDPYFWQNPFNVLITGLEEEEVSNTCDPYFRQTIHIFGKAPRVTKNGLPGPQKLIFFTQIYFFSRIDTLDFCFLREKKRTHLGQV